MKVEIVYDDETTAILDRLYAALEEYKKLLKPLHEERTKGWTCSRDVEADFEWDEGLQAIEGEIAKVKEHAIPVRMIILHHQCDIIPHIIR